MIAGIITFIFMITTYAYILQKFLQIIPLIYIVAIMIVGIGCFQCCIFMIENSDKIITFFYHGFIKMLVFIVKISGNIMGRIMADVDAELNRW